MKRRDMLKLTGAAIVGASAFPVGWTAAAEKKKQKILYFTRSAGFEHEAVKRKDGQLGYGEQAMKEMAERSGLEIEITKDGAVFDGDLAAWDLIMFYTSGDLTAKELPKGRKEPGSPMSPAGKEKLLKAIDAGKPFYGIHAATDSFRSAGIDPYIAMIGGEFVRHGKQQVATVKVTSPSFPGIGGRKSLSLNEEWYAMSKFPNDLHVILLQETEGMEGKDYARPPFPATWARMHGQGRVYYTSFGHREDIWQNPDVQEIMLGGVAWCLGNAEADVTPNIEKVAPKANQLP
ncbi:MAG: ThuA domain-containing protein [Planctomycetota bacterium]